MTENFGNSPFDLSKMIADVEGYIGLPAGTIKPFFSAGEEWVFVLKIASIVETVLKSAIMVRVESNAAIAANPFARALMGTILSQPLRTHILRIPLRGDIGAVALAENFGLLDRRDGSFIDAVTSIRNRYAHSVVNHSKSVFEIVSESRDQNQVAAIRKRLRYSLDNVVEGEGSIILDMEFGTLMFLTGMSARLRPVPTPPGGILSELMRKSEADPTKQNDQNDD
jgi:hypothetical protein